MEYQLLQCILWWKAYKWTPFKTRQVPIDKFKDIVIKGNDPSKKAEEVEDPQVAFCTIFVFQIKEFEWPVCLLIFAAPK